MSKLRCRCTLKVSVAGDVCRYCQPQGYIDRLKTRIDENKQDSVILRARVAELESHIGLLAERFRELEQIGGTLHPLREAFGEVEIREPQEGEGDG